MIGQNIIFVSADTQIRHSTDKSRLFLVEPGISSGATFTYTAATNTFGVERDENGFLGNGTAAVNRDGTLVALAAGATIDLETAPDLNVIHNFAGGSGVAFSATEDTLFILDQTFSEVVAFDTSNFAERYRFSTGDKVTGEAPNRLGLGNFGSSPDGRYLALITPTAVRLYDTSNPAAPTPSPIPVTTPTPPPTPTPWPTPSPTPTPAPKPVVTVTVSPSQVSEGDVAFFTVTASPQSSRPVDIFYTMSGKAVSGGDYSLNNDPNSPGRATIPLGQDSVTISFTAIVDQAKEKSETATMTLSSSAGYDFPNTGGTGGKKKKKKAPTAPQATVTISANK